jgi:outer membrane lipoprotein carrier protein
MRSALSTWISSLAAFVFLLPVLIGGQAFAQASSDEVIERLRASYETIDALQATFTQHGGGTTIEGTIILSGDRYRVELADQVLVSDGATAWAYSSIDNQVLINRHIDDAGAFSPSTFFTQYPEHFNVQPGGSEIIRGAGHDVLRLTPRQRDMQVRDVTLFVRTSDSIPTRVRITDMQGGTLVFELTDIEKNPRLPAGTFQFRAPSGTETIDLR